MSTVHPARLHAGATVEARRHDMYISVAVPTCNRPDDLSRLLASLARVRYPYWELLLIDQSEGDETELLAAAWGALIPRIVYLRMEVKNASAARNLAIENANGDVLAFIDDDCTVRPDWLARVSESFDQEPNASLIFGTVSAGDHDPITAFVPTHSVRRERRLRGSSGGLRVFLSAMGANMSLRLTSGRRLHFDPALGPGARFRSSHDGDYAYRLLAAGEMVVETPTVAVLHHGARPYAGGAASLKVRDYMYGAGAAHAKLLRCGEWIMIVAIIGRLVGSIAAIRPQNVLWRRPTHIGRSLMYIRGLRDSFQLPVDQTEKVYRVSAQTGLLARSEISLGT